MLATSANAEDYLFVMAAGMLTIDYLQTLEIMESDNHYETNPVITNKATATGWFIGMQLINFVAHKSKSPWKPILQGFIIGGTLTAIRTNYQIGIRIGRTF